jgi:hypothetical protein
MPIIHCSEKLRKEMGLKDSDLVPVKLIAESLGSWHANLLLIKRKKCVLFVNDRTRMNFIVPDVTRDCIKELGTMFIGMLHTVLVEEGFTEAQCKTISGNGAAIRFSKTASKSVLGSVNDFAAHYEYRILEAGSLHSPEIPDIIRQLNRMPVSSIKYQFPVDAMRAAVETET